MTKLVLLYTYVYTDEMKYYMQIHRVFSISISFSRKFEIVISIVTRMGSR